MPDLQPPRPPSTLPTTGGGLRLLGPGHELSNQIRIKMDEPP